MADLIAVWFRRLGVFWQKRLWPMRRVFRSLVSENAWYAAGVGYHWRKFEQLQPLVTAYRRSGRKAGHAEEKLRVGINAIGYLAETRKDAVHEFYPAYAEIFGPIGQRLGWPPLDLARFEDLCAGPNALLVGGPTEMRGKISYINQMLGGLSRLSLQMSLGSMPLDERLRSITLFAGEVR